MIVTQFVDRCSSHPLRPQLHSTSSFNYAGIHSPVICVLLPVVVVHLLLLLLHNHLWWWTVCWALLSVCPKQIVVVSHGGPLNWAPTLLPGMIILIRLHLGTLDGGQYNKNDTRWCPSPLRIRWRWWSPRVLLCIWMGQTFRWSKLYIFYTFLVFGSSFDPSPLIRKAKRRRVDWRKPPPSVTLHVVLRASSSVPKGGWTWI